MTYTYEQIKEYKSKIDCRHGKMCYRYGCAFEHPFSRFVGADCPKGWGCRDTNCGLHHPTFQQNHQDKKEMILQLKNGTYCPPIEKKIKKYYWWLNDKYGGVHPSKGKNVEHKTHQCSICGKPGHNARTCPITKLKKIDITKLPPPPPQFL